VTDELHSDVPRRAYPLVVPPPGGFEEAVHRGRRVRRRRTGSGSALTLAAVGVIAYSMLGHGGATNSLQPIDQAPVHQPQHPVPGATASPALSPQAPADTRSGAAGRNTVVAQPSGNPGAAGVVPGGPVYPPPVGNPPSSRPFAPRAAISAPQDLGPNTDASCFALSTNTQNWCATATATPENDGTYTLTYTLCRNVNAGHQDLHFDRTEQVDFVAKDVEHDDTVWTYSIGVAVTPANGTVGFDPGYCKAWTVVWNGYDDYGDNPAPGRYQIFAQSLAFDGNVPSDVGDFQHG
jgi:hypothetical protein